MEDKEITKTIQDLRDLLGEMRLTSVRYGLKPNIHRAWCERIDRNIFRLIAIEKEETNV